MKRIFIASAVFVLLLASAIPTRAQSPLEAYPDTVALVIRFESVGRFVGNVNDMLGAISPGAAAASRDFENEALGRMFELHDHMDAVDRQAPAYLGVFPVEVGGPPTCMLVKAPDEKQLRAALMNLDDVKQLEDAKSEVLANGFTRYEGVGRRVYMARWGEYWLFTRSEQVADAMTLKQDKRRSMAQVLDARARKVFDAGDASAAVNSSHLAAKFKDQIDEARKQAHDNIDGLPDEQLGNYAELTKKVYHDLADLGFDALFDSTWAVGNVSLSAAGAQAEALAGFKQDSKTDKLLAANATSSLETLGLLPSGAPMYFGIALDYDKFLDPWTRATYGAAADTPEAQEAAKEGAALMREGKVKSTVLSYSLPGDGGSGISVATLQEAQNVSKLRLGYRKFMQAVRETKTALFSMAFSLKPDAETYREHKIDLMTMKFKFLGEGEFAALSGMYEKMFGGDRYETRITSLGSLMVQATGNDASFIRKVLDGASSGEGVVALEDAYGKTRDKLADQANAMVLIDGPRVVVDSVRLISTIEPFATGLRAAPFNFGVKPAPSYSGLSLGAEPQGLRLKAFVPVEQPRGILQIFAPGL